MELWKCVNVEIWKCGKLKSVNVEMWKVKGYIALLNFYIFRFLVKKSNIWDDLISYIFKESLFSNDKSSDIIDI